MHEAELLLPFPAAIADALAGALAPEASLSEVPKTRAEITNRDGALHIHIRADDLAALRAAVNSYLRWIDAGERSARAANAP